MTIVPTNMDVLCGKDRACLQAEGSRRFRDIIDSHMPKYMQCKTKFEKMQYTKRIYEQVTRDARFLKFNEAEQAWEEISVMAARDKVGHALRFASRAKRRNNKTKKTHKRTGSGSSSCSSESSSAGSAGSPAPFAWNSLIGQIHNGVDVPEESASSSNVEQQLAATEDCFASADSLDAFLALDFNFDSNDDLPQEDPLDNFMDDMLKAVKIIEAEEATEEESLLSLLSEPMGEWEEDLALSELPV
ncbi:expressed unknown protein [Seminavis robusta]|uniref:DUF6824 domain-containing protein n=1 Tax=Seminavis robusta TaxID=568900 RepID=A0A9N8DCN1_9STRA|nr:expressed unknown protein [Seminavis robusta]|eukprot:Sro91_g047920.1 n/a (245) ;mRNA; f:119371-120105